MLEMLETLLLRGSWRDALYVYRLDGRGTPIRPALIKGQPFPDLQDCLRDEHGGGAFRVMIRRGETMLLSGRIDIEPPSRRCSRDVWYRR